MRISIHDAIVEAPGGPAYTGEPGQTRLQTIHLAGSGGGVAVHQVYRAIHAGTHPELKERALAGELHRLSDGRKLSLPFIYHDPDERKFALVLPDELRHLEFREWAALMGEIAADTSAAVPSYVREASVVVGWEALRRLAAAAEQLDESELTAAEDDGSPEAVAMQAQERRLSRMAELLSAREAELLRREAELRAERLRLQQREQMLIAKLAELRHEAQIIPSAAQEGEWEEVAGALEFTPSPPELPGQAAAAAPRPRLHSVPPPLRVASRHSLPPPLRPRGTRGAQPPWQAEGSQAPWQAPEGGDHPPPLPRAGQAEARPEVSPPPGFRRKDSGSMAFRLVDDELWLFAAMDALTAAALGRTPEFLLQCVTAKGVPVLVLSLVGVRAEGQAGARLTLDGLTGDASAILATLESAYRARVALFAGGRYHETLTLSTLREGVAKAARERVEQLRPTAVAEDAAAAVAEVVAAPPPLDSDDLPFGPARRPLSSTGSALAAAEQLESWLSDERLSLATLVYSVPSHVVDASARRVLRAAMGYGVGLSDRLVQAAVDFGVVATPAELLRHQLEAFQVRILQGENDLDERATRRNWDRLFEQAADFELDVDESLRNFASFEGDEAAIDRRATLVSFEDFSDDELQEKLTVSGVRVAAFQALCERLVAPAIPALCSSLQNMAPGEVARSAPHLLRFGERVADTLLLCLGSRNAAVRHASALSMGRLRLGRHVSALLRRVDQEPSVAWREMARALGEYGPAAFVEAVEMIPKAERSERFVVLLGHLANHGCARDVENLENNANATLSGLARRAMAGRAKLQWEDLAVREQRSLAENSPAARFSQAFYAEAAKVDI